MPILAWDETEFLDCLEVVPKVEDYEVAHEYDVHRNGLRLLLTVRKYESTIQIRLYRETSDIPLFEFAAFVRGPARYINDKRGKYLEINDCIVAPSRFWYIEAGAVFNPAAFPVSVSIEIARVPDIRIAFVPHRSTT